MMVLECLEGGGRRGRTEFSTTMYKFKKNFKNLHCDGKIFFVEKSMKIIKRRTSTMHVGSIGNCGKLGKNAENGSIVKQKYIYIFIDGS